MKVPIRTIVIFSDEIQIYRGSRCRIYAIPPFDPTKRRTRIIGYIWDSGRVKSCKESKFVPGWDITYELK